MGFSTHKRIAILIPARLGYLGGVLAGVGRFLATHPECVSIWTSDEADLRHLKAWKPDGLLCYLVTKDQVGHLNALGRPYVNVSGTIETPGMARVSVDNVKVGQLAGAYFVERHFRKLACVTSLDRWYATQRSEGFLQAAEEAGIKAQQFDQWFISWSHFSERHDKSFDRLREFLSGLAVPTGVYCVTDEMALVVSEVARELGLRVPEDLAILGTDNNAVVCHLTQPAISSVDLPMEEVGFRAGEVLLGMLRGEGRPEGAILLPPKGVVTRRSTDLVAIHDREVAQALEFIHANAHRSIGVSDVLEHVAISRRVLELRFRKLLGRSPMLEIQRVHVERAKSLLAETDWQMSEIAKRSGFTSAVHLSTLFRLRTGTTPARYRRDSRRERMGAGPMEGAGSDAGFSK